MFKRSSGILAHITSLPSDFGMGDFGPQAYRFVDWLVKAKQTWWQILPLNPVDRMHGSSPYSSCSAFALNKLMISPELLVQNGWISESILATDQALSMQDWDNVVAFKQNLIEQAFDYFQESNHYRDDFDRFCFDEQWWLNDFALFMVCKEAFGQKPWIKWRKDFRQRNAKTLEIFTRKHELKILRVKFEQFLAWRQWQALKAYANGQGIRFIGDMPIYVNYDGVEVWTHPEYFQLMDDLKQNVVAGVPPDYFSEDGQRWGNPLYNWDTLKQDNYSWWVKRLGHGLQLCDVVRIDHFRALSEYWSISAKEKTAKKGKWEPGPGASFFEVMKQHWPSLPIIAEDLGIITQDVQDLRDQFHLPGMKILMFAFGEKYRENPYFPENIPENAICYTGTHDNNTVRGWFEEDMNAVERWHLCEYLKRDITADDVADVMMNIAMQTKAALAIIPLQDVFALDSDHRMNTPSTIGQNWLWQAQEGLLTSEAADNLATLTSKYARSPE